jgi:hypothetical protein
VDKSILVGSREFLRSPMFFTIPIELYNVYVFFSCGQSDEELLKWLKSTRQPIPENFNKKSTYGNAYGNGYNFRFENGNQLIRLQNPEIESVAFYEALTHEVAHASFDILYKAGMKLSLDSEEAFTYLIGFINKKIISKISKVPKK